VLPLARKLVEFEVTESLGFDGEYRQRKLEGSADSVDLITDNGNLIFDITIPPALASDEESLYEMDNDLKTLPGVVDHGLFLLECQTLLIEWPGGRIETRSRDDEN
jgi:ribose 5-phosphate isomerase